MSTATRQQRLGGLVGSLRPAIAKAMAMRRFESAIKQPGTLDRLFRIAEHGASDDDLEWLERMTNETGFDFHLAVAACVELNEEY